MFWPVIFEAASNVRPERAPKQKGRYCFWKSLFVGHQTAHTASTADSKPSRQQSADHNSMSLISVLQSPTEVRPRATLLQHYNVVINPRIYFFSIFLSCTSTPKKVAHRREPQKKKSRAYIRIKKKKGNGQKREYPVLFWPKTDVPESNSGRECCWPYLIGPHRLSPVFGQKRPGTPGKSYFAQLPPVFGHFLFRFWSFYVPFRWATRLLRTYQHGPEENFSLTLLVLSV